MPKPSSSPARLAFMALLFIVAQPAMATPPDRFVWQIMGVKDGDTLTVTLPGLPAPLNPIAVRLRSVDTPESGGRAKCAAERALAKRATHFTRDAIRTGRLVEFEAPSWDKYGGRVDAEVWIDGERLAEKLIAAGLGRAYSGGKRGGWC